MPIRWYAIQLVPQLTETAAANLRQQSFPYFFPQIEIKVNRKTTVIQPMFKGYGFVSLDLQVDRWLSVNGTRGVVGLLPRHAKIPLPLPVGLVETFQANNPMKESQFLETLDHFFPGITRVEVNDRHPLLSGRRGLVVGVRSRLLQISFMVNADYGSQPVWLDKDQVTPILDE